MWNIRMKNKVKTKVKTVAAITTLSLAALASTAVKAESELETYVKSCKTLHHTWNIPDLKNTLQTQEERDSNAHCRAIFFATLTMITMAGDSVQLHDICQPEGLTHKQILNKVYPFLATTKMDTDLPDYEPAMATVEAFAKAFPCKK